MSETAGVEPTGAEPAAVNTPADSGQAPETPPSGGDNPNWSTILDVLPTSLHEIVKPVLKTWDQGIDGRFQEIHQQYDPYKPFVEQKVDPNELAQAYALLQAINENPKQIWDQMAQYYGYTGEGGQGNSGGTAPQPVPTVPPTTQEGQYDFGSPEANTAWQQMSEQVRQQQELLLTMGNAFLSEKQQAEQAQVDQVLNTQLAEAKTKHGDFDEAYVLSLVAQGLDVDKAVESFKAAVASALEASKRPPAPTVMGGAGGPMPTNAVDPAKMNDKETKDLVIAMLQAGKQS